MTENWTCPFCNREQIVVPEQRCHTTQKLKLARHKFNKINKNALAGYAVTARACANPKCQEIEIQFTLSSGGLMPTSAGGYQFILTPSGSEIMKVRPTASYKSQPDCIPEPLAMDYYEACKIRDLSPKSSATLARRVIQGMIRDFCGISKSRLVDEIDELRKRVAAGTAPAGVHADTVEAMHHVRTIGNIGAHMEKDISIIVDVDPGEAETLIHLVELLFKEWYVGRDQRQQTLADLKTISAAKSAAKAAPSAPSIP